MDDHEWENEWVPAFKAAAEAMAKEQQRLLEIELADLDGMVGAIKKYDDGSFGQRGPRVLIFTKFGGAIQKALTARICEELGQSQRQAGFYVANSPKAVRGCRLRCIYLSPSAMPSEDDLRHLYPCLDQKGVWLPYQPFTSDEIIN
ncbi:MAG: hypothetical protein ACIAQU_04265 [Phycisphaerales bacterium JB064]